MFMNPDSVPMSTADVHRRGPGGGVANCGAVAKRLARFREHTPRYVGALTDCWRNAFVDHKQVIISIQRHSVRIKGGVGGSPQDQGRYHGQIAQLAASIRT